MTVSTISQEDITPDFSKRHTRFDKDHDNDRTLSKHEHEHSYRSTIGAAEQNAEDDAMTRKNLSQTRAQSSSPSYAEHSELPKVFEYDANDTKDNDKLDSNNRARRSNSIDDKHQPTPDYNGRRPWDQERSSERTNRYNRSTRSSLESYKAYEKDDVHTDSHNDQDSQMVQDEANEEKDNVSNPGDDGEMNDDMISEDEDQLEDDEYDENGGSPGSRDDGTNSKNEDESDSTALSGGVRKPVKVRSMFVDKLYRMVEDQSIQHLISWAKEGDMFYVYNCIKLSDDVLPKFFKHNNWQSFVRQLNMYGFHKKESTLNRKNPETQRWQFYHPHFQRDHPHLRKSIKRKSARNTISAPSTSRIIFEHEHGRGFFLQRDDRSRSNSGEGGHISTPSQSISRGHEGKSTPTKLSPGHQHQVAHSPYSQPTTAHPKAGPRPPSNSQNQRDSEHRDLAMLQQLRDPRSHYSYPNQQHQRQNTYPNSHSYGNRVHSPDRAYDHNTPRSPVITHDPHHLRSHPPQSPYRSTRPILPAHYPNNEIESDSPHGASAGHLRHHSAPGADLRKTSINSRESDHSNSPMGYHHDTPQSPGFQSGSTSHLHRPHGSIGDNNTAERSPRGPPPQSSHLHPSYNEPHRQDRLPSLGGEVVQKDSSQPPTPSLPSGNKLDTPLTPVFHPSSQVISSPSRSYFPQVNHPSSSPTSPHQIDRNSHNTVRDLEGRLRAMEDAYASLQQYTHKLQQAQTSQDRTIQWMRERLDYMTDSIHARQGPISSPLIHPSKRKAEPIPDDPRGRARFDSVIPRHDSGTAFGVDGPPDQHHAHGYGRGGPGPAGQGYLPGEGQSNGSYHEHSPASSGQPQSQHPHNDETQRSHHSMPMHMHQQQMQGQSPHSRPYRPHLSSGKSY
ncbi:hypothetical protein BGZ49_006162 [Haplosporangium sp. Z 27]|nr:hypothetical protein BGZ49_006162 [Haplosporangium sp. Z 27]